MCLAVPGKIIEIKNAVAKVDYGTEIREGQIVTGDFKVGDYVIIQGKIVLEKISDAEAKRWKKFVQPDKPA